MRIITYTCCFLLLAGCARIPEPIGYQYTVQPKMQAAYHWVVLASDVANRINNQLVLSDYARTPVYVRPTCGDEDTPCTTQESSSFSEAFRDLLITELVRFGVPVRQNPDEASITVHYKVQLVHYNAKRIRTIQPGLMTAVAAGVMVFRNAPHELGTIAAVGLLDYLNTAGARSSSHEVIITTSMVAKEKYLFRTSDLYYINDADAGQYRDIAANTAADIPLIGPKGEHAQVVVKRSEPGSSENAVQETVMPTTVEPKPLIDENVVIPEH